MTWRRSPFGGFAADTRRECGFTLIELLVVLIILGLSLVLIADYKPPWSRGLELRGAAGDVVTALRLARSEAISRNRPVTFEIDLASRSFHVDAHPAKSLPGNYTITVTMADREQLSASAGAIRFNPDGSSSGGSIGLANGGEKIAVQVDWLSGRVGIVK
jgi:general secretion pathway protein H